MKEPLELDFGGFERGADCVAGHSQAAAVVERCSTALGRRLAVACFHAVPMRVMCFSASSSFAMSPRVDSVMQRMQ